MLTLRCIISEEQTGTTTLTNMNMKLSTAAC